MIGALAATGLTPAQARALQAELRRQREAKLAAQRAAHMAETQALLVDEARESFRAFIDWTFPGYVWDQFHVVLAQILQWVSDEILAGREPRVIVEAPPRHGKTEQISKRFPVWHQQRAARLGLRHDVMLCSSSEGLAEDNSRVARDIAREAAPSMPELGLPIRGKNAVTDWQTYGGMVRARGAGGDITGRGVNLAIIDDIVKNAEQADSERIRQKTWDWWQSVMNTRIEAGGGVIVLMTRWHEDDLVGRLVTDPAVKDDWHRVRLPAIAEEDEVGRPFIPGTGIVGWRKKGEALSPIRWGLDRLAAKKRSSGPRWWSAMFQADPSPSEGAVYQRAWFGHRYDHDPQRPERPYAVIRASIDCNSKEGIANSDSACSVWGEGGMAAEGHHHMLDEPFCQSMAYPDLERAVLDMLRKWQPHELIIEDRAAGTQLLDVLERIIFQFCHRHGIRVPTLVRYDPQGTSKEARADVTSRWWRLGYCWLPESAPWVGDWIEDQVKFRKASKRKDRTDAQTQYLLHATTGEDGRTAVEQAYALADVF